MTRHSPRTPLRPAGGSPRRPLAPFVRVLEQLEDRSVPASLFDVQTPASFVGSLNNNGSAATADFNGDGKQDLVVSNYGALPSDPGQTVTVLFGDGAGGFGSPIVLNVGVVSNVSFVAVGDLDGDSDIDIVSSQDTLEPNNVGSVSVFLNDGNGGFARTTGSPINSDGNNTFWVGIGEFTSDGIPDLAVASGGIKTGETTFSGNNVAIFQGLGEGKFSRITIIANGLRFIPTSAAIADYDSDGKQDLAVVVPGIPENPDDPLPAGQVQIWSGNGGGGFALGSSYESGGVLPVHVQAADLTGDGKPDLVVANAGDPDEPTYAGFGLNTGLGVLINGGTGSFGPTTKYTAGLTSAFAVAVEDYDVDGKQDVAVMSFGHPSDPTSGAKVAVFTGNGAGSFTPNDFSPYDTETGMGQFLVAGRFDGNTTPDVVAVGFTNRVTTLLNITAPAADTTTTLDVAPASPSTYGQAVTLTATVASTAGTPTGTVTFLLNGVAISGGTNVVLDGSGVAAFVTAATQLPAGGHTLTAQYNGVPGFAKSSDAETYTVNKATTETALLVAPPNPVTPGAGLTFTATVTGPGAPTGPVAFFKGDVLLGQANLADAGGQRKATFVMSSAGWAAGNYDITAKYAANLNWLGDDSDPYTLTIAAAQTADTTITISSAAPNPSLATQAVTISALVTATAGVPTGTVQFFADGNLLGTGDLAAGPGGQVATFVVSTLGIGAHTLTASYLGVAGLFNPSGPSSPVSHTVNPIPSIVFLTSSGSPSLVTQPVTFTAVAAPVIGQQTGTVTFWDGGVQIGSAELAAVGSQQVATFTGVLAAGSHTVTAKYAAQGNFAASGSAPITQVVNPVGTTTVVTSSLNPADEGQAVTFTATVAWTVAIAVAPTGTVTFFDGGTAIGTATLSGGVATFTTSTLVPGTHVITVAFSGDANFTASTSAALSQAVNTPVTPPPPPVGSGPELIGFREFAVGAGAGRPAEARFFNPDGSERFSLNLFPGLTGGVRVTSADFNGDGVADMVAGTGPGSASQVRVLDGVTRAELFQVAPFEAAFVGGVFVASGDVNGDGVPDIVVSPDEGGGPRIQVYSGAGFVKIDDFFGIDDPDFRGGARAGVGDLNGDGVGDLVVSAGFGGGPRVAAFDGTTLGNSRVKLFADFFAFEAALRNGAFVAAGDLDGDGKADLIAGGGPGGGPRVTAFGGDQLLGNRPVPIANFFGGDVNNRGGVRVAARDLDGDDLADLVIGDGTDAGSRVTAYAGKRLLESSPPPELFAFDAYPGFTGGVYVG